jgi:hypothetical protein
VTDRHRVPRVYTIEEVLDFLAEHPGSTQSEIAVGIGARASAIRTLLHVGVESQMIAMAGRGTPRHPATYTVAVRATDALGRKARRSQNERIAAVLRDGRPHTSAEIEHRCGSSRLNSRIANLRDPKKAWGMNIVGRDLKHEGKVGADAYEYQLVGYKPGFDENGRIGTSEATAARAANPAAVASDASKHVSPNLGGGVSDSTQLGIGEAA